MAPQYAFAIFLALPCAFRGTSFKKKLIWLFTSSWKAESAFVSGCFDMNIVGMEPLLLPAKSPLQNRSASFIAVSSSSPFATLSKYLPRQTNCVLKLSIISIKAPAFLETFCSPVSYSISSPRLVVRNALFLVSASFPAPSANASIADCSPRTPFFTPMLPAACVMGMIFVIAEAIFPATMFAETLLPSVFILL